jgi:hypothetical protein
MPAEWEPHEATWLAWPHERADWPGKFTPIAWVYGEVVRWLSQREKVRILLADRDAEDAARRVLAKCGANLGAVEFFRHATNRSWTRDYCPIFVRNAKGEVAVTNWIFNGWAKYGNWRQDNQIPAFIAKRTKLREFEPGIVLEGGSIEVNGAGLLLTTEECLLSEKVQVRNPGLGRAEMERYFADYLGIQRTVWLKNGIAGDDTRGQLRTPARESGAPAADRPARRNAAHAGARLFRRPEVAGQLRELLYRERRAAGSNFQRSDGSSGPEHAYEAFSRQGSSRDSRSRSGARARDAALHDHAATSLAQRAATGPDADC